MLRLQKYILTQLLPSTSASISQLHRLISAAAPAVSPNPSFAVEDYLVATCGLTRPQALKASAKLSHLKSPTNPDAVHSFLAGLGLSTGDVAALVNKDPKFLCAGVEETPTPNVVGLTRLGLSRSEVARLVSLGPDRFRRRSIVSTLEYCLPLFGSSENLLRAARRNSNFLILNPERTAKPNVKFLQECGLGACNIAKLCGRVPLLLSTNLERVRTMVSLAEGLGVPRGSGMFRRVMQAVAFQSEETITAKVEFLKKTFRWSDAEVSIAVPRAPSVLRKSNKSLQHRSNFLISEVGLEPAYIAHHPAMLMYSLEGRVRPQYYVVKFLKENGLLDHNRDYYGTIMISEKLFMERFICPHKEAAPHLAEDYATSCRGEVPARFSFT